MTLLRQGQSELGAFVQSPLGVRGLGASPDLIYVSFGVTDTLGVSLSTQSRMITVDLANGRVVHSLAAPLGQSTLSATQAAIGSDGTVYFPGFVSTQFAVASVTRDLSALVDVTGSDQLIYCGVTDSGNPVFGPFVYTAVLDFIRRIFLPPTPIGRSDTNSNQLSPTICGDNVVLSYTTIDTLVSYITAFSRAAVSGIPQWTYEIEVLKSVATARNIITSSTSNAVGTFHFMYASTPVGSNTTDFIIVQMDLDGNEIWRTTVYSSDQVTVGAQGQLTLSLLAPLAEDTLFPDDFNLIHFYTSPDSSIFATPWHRWDAVAGRHREVYLRLYDGATGAFLRDLDLPMDEQAQINGHAPDSPGIDIMDDGRIAVSYLSVSDPTMARARLYSAADDVIWDEEIRPTGHRGGFGPPTFTKISLISDITA